MASKAGADGQFRAVERGGGLYTTQLSENGKPSLTMGALSTGVKATAPVPYKQAPQLQHHLQYAAPKKKKVSSRADRKMSEQQKVERR